MQHKTIIVKLFFKTLQNINYVEKLKMIQTLLEVSILKNI